MTNQGRKDDGKLFVFNYNFPMKVSELSTNWKQLFLVSEGVKVQIHGIVEQRHSNNNFLTMR